MNMKLHGIRKKDVNLIASRNVDANDCVSFSTFALERVGSSTDDSAIEKIPIGSCTILSAYERAETPPSGRRLAIFVVTKIVS